MIKKNKKVTLSNPLLSQSQTKFRLGLVRQRTRTYPLDSMDFIMMDLERPEGHHRHASQCAGDLTGRWIPFWITEHMAMLYGVTGKQEYLPGSTPSATKTLFGGGFDGSTGFCHASPHVIATPDRFRHVFGPCGSMPTGGTEKRFLVNRRDSCKPFIQNVNLAK
jgi:hypothetical protein